MTNIMRRFACAVAAIGITAGLAQAASETLLHTFATPPKGANPYAGVILDHAGNLYGTTFDGGAAGLGVVFKVNTAGQEIVLHSFMGGSDGKNPRAGVVRDSSGNLYGTTYEGGTYGAGIVYKVTPTGVETVLYSFTGGSDGGYPWGGVTFDSAGNLYGTTELGGSAFRGVVFKLDTTGTETVLYTFSGGNDGSEPTAGVILDSSNNIYGTTYYGGASGAGVVFELDATGHETPLYSFSNGSDGGYPWAGVIRDASGNLYGTTNSGGTDGVGVVYKVDTTGLETVVHSFQYGAGGSSPNAGVIRDSAGNLYGTTYSGGGNGGWGVVYKLSAAGHETVLYTFTGGNDGAYPSWAGVVRDSSGNFYGTTGSGGTGNSGVVFKLDTSRVETVLCSFPSPADGGNSYAGVVRDSSGAFYGTTSTGGTNGYGIVYKLVGRTETVLHTFTGGADGGQPRAGVVLDAAGNLYGTTYQGGANGWGAVYKVDTTGNETVLYSFTLGPDGGFPESGVTLDSAGNIYGTSLFGGTFGAGVVYKVDTSGNETAIYSFTGGLDGGFPQASVTLDSAGNIYGTTPSGGSGYGVVFKVDTSGNETVLYTFTGGADGGTPYAGVTRDTAGNLYGTASQGGTGFSGVVYKVDSTGLETVLHNFTYTDGASPYAGVLRNSAGTLYGTTYQGGANYQGVVFKLNAAGTYTLMYSFTGGADGGQPRGGVIADSSGDLFGTTYSGGAKSTGVVFKVTP